MRIRGALFLFWMYGLIFLLGFVFLPVLFLPVRWVIFPLRIWLALVFGGLRVLVGITFEVEGIKNIPLGSVLVASKHQSMFDVLLPWRLFAFPALILKQELSWIPVFGWYVLKLKNIAIDRGGKAKALRKMLAKTRVLASKNRQLMIFPEGTRVIPSQKAPYKPGVAAMYKEMNVPCLPIALNSGLYWPGHGLQFRKGVIKVRILPAIAPGLERKAFMTKLEKKIETATNELVQQDVKDKTNP